MKLLGLALVSGAGWGLGWQKKRSLSGRAELLSALITALGLMEDEISQLRMPLPELFASQAENGPECLRHFFTVLSEETGSRSFAGLWRESCDALPLDREEKGILFALGGNLGRYDAERQGAALALARRGLAAILDRCREELRSKAASWPALGLSLGAMAGVLLL